MEKSKLLASIMLALTFLATGITSVNAATIATDAQLAAVTDAVQQGGDIKAVMQDLMADFAASLMEQGYTPDEFQAAIASIMGELIAAIPADADNYASLVEQAFSGAMLGVAAGIETAAAANPDLDQAAYVSSAQAGLASAAQEVSDNNPSLNVDTLMSAIGTSPVVTPAPTVVEPPTVIETPPTQDTTASPT